MLVLVVDSVGLVGAVLADTGQAVADIAVAAHMAAVELVEDIPASYHTFLVF